MPENFMEVQLVTNAQFDMAELILESLKLPQPPMEAEFGRKLALHDNFLLMQQELFQLAMASNIRLCQIVVFGIKSSVSRNSIS